MFNSFYFADLRVLILLTGRYTFPSMFVLRIWRHIKTMSLYFRHSRQMYVWRCHDALGRNYMFVTPENKRENQMGEPVNLLTKVDKASAASNHKRKDRFLFKFTLCSSHRTDDLQPPSSGDLMHRRERRGVNEACFWSSNKPSNNLIRCPSSPLFRCTCKG